jgi:hypothetical protein
MKFPAQFFCFTATAVLILSRLVHQFFIYLFIVVVAAADDVVVVVAAAAIAVVVVVVSVVGRGSVAVFAADVAARGLGVVSPGFFSAFLMYLASRVFPLIFSEISFFFLTKSFSIHFFSLYTFCRYTLPHRTHRGSSGTPCLPKKLIIHFVSLYTFCFSLYIL